jgi:hypothetical protein
VEQAYGSDSGTQAGSDGLTPGAIGGSGGRWDEVAILAGYYQGRDSGKSLAETAREQGIPESTLRHWVGRLEASDGPPAWARFFESPEGLQLLHMIVTAAIVVLTQFCGGGVRTVCLFLQLSGLWRFAAAGYGSQCAAIQAMEQRIGEFGDLQRERLASQMPQKPITLTEDETFHVGRPCLVASEPVSDFLLIEEYADDRRADTWTAKVMPALEGLPVEVVQTTSDDARALVKHAQDCLGVHHSPDLFHPQQDISRATSLPLGRKITDAENALAGAQKALEEVQQQAEAYAQTPHGPGRPPNFAKWTQQAEQEVEDAQVVLDEARQRQETVRQEARGISRSYHPFDLETAEVRDAATVGQDINEHFDAIEEAAREAGISVKCWDLLQKARRVVPKMVATIVFVHAKILEMLSALDESERVKAALSDYLVPLLYLKEVARKATTADARDTVLQSCERLQQRSAQAIAVLEALAPQQRASIEYVARICAQFFQRSSSNVEGRNGFLALRHHSLHHLCPRKLRALTAIHNYMIRRRSDGLTPAERFFEQSHDDMFQYLLMTLPPPKRPAARRATAPSAPRVVN